MDRRLKRSKKTGFTLVELLVVIAIIGVLIALLLPAVQAAREAARRTQCINQLKQIGLATLGHADQKGIFPTGGSIILPDLETYVVNGVAVGAEKMGLSWGYQILPFLEKGTVADAITSPEVMQATIIPEFVCPSRRAPVVIEDILSPDIFVALLDYSAAMPCGYEDYTQETRYVPNEAANRTTRLFGGTGSTYVLDVPADELYLGVIARTPYKFSSGTPGGRGGSSASGFVKVKNVTQTISFQQIEDGTSNTMMFGEKFIRPDLYEGGSWGDDRGWTDGWDTDTIRSTCYKPLPDALTGETSNDTLYGPETDVVNFGSAHPGAFNTVLADGSVQSVSYDVDPLVFDNFGDRRDGQIFNVGDL